MTTSIQMTDKIVYAEYNKNITPVKLEDIINIRISKDSSHPHQYYIWIRVVNCKEPENRIIHMDPVKFDPSSEEDITRMEEIKRFFLEHNYFPIYTWTGTTTLFSPNFTYGKGNFLDNIEISRENIRPFSYYISFPGRKAAYPEFVRQRNKYFTKQKEASRNERQESSIYQIL